MSQKEGNLMVIKANTKNEVTNNFNDLSKKIKNFFDKGVAVNNLAEIISESKIRENFVELATYKMFGGGERHLDSLYRILKEGLEQDEIDRTKFESCFKDYYNYRFHSPYLLEFYTSLSRDTVLVYDLDKDKFSINFRSDIDSYKLNCIILCKVTGPTLSAGPNILKGVSRGWIKYLVSDSDFNSDGGFSEELVDLSSLLVERLKRISLDVIKKYCLDSDNSDSVSPDLDLVRIKEMEKPISNSLITTEEILEFKKIFNDLNQCLRFATDTSTNERIFEFLYSLYFKDSSELSKKLRVLIEENFVYRHFIHNSLGVDLDVSLDGAKEFVQKCFDKSSNFYRKAPDQDTDVYIFGDSTCISYLLENGFDFNDLFSEEQRDLVLDEMFSRSLERDKELKLEYMRDKLTNVVNAGAFNFRALYNQYSPYYQVTVTVSTLKKILLSNKENVQKNIIGYFTDYNILIYPDSSASSLTNSYSSSFSALNRAEKQTELIYRAICDVFGNPKTVEISNSVDKDNKSPEKTASVSRLQTKMFINSLGILDDPDIQLITTTPKEEFELPDIFDSFELIEKDNDVAFKDLQSKPTIVVKFGGLVSIRDILFWNNFK